MAIQLPTFAQFQSTRKEHDDISKVDGFENNMPAAGNTYWDDRLSIEKKSDHEYYVELFGGDDYGSLEYCERELFDAALCESVFDDCFTAEFAKTDDYPIKEIRND